MPVTITDDDFRAIYEYFHASFSATNNENVHEVLDRQEDAWDRVQRIAQRAGYRQASPAHTADRMASGEEPKDGQD